MFDKLLSLWHPQNTLVKLNSLTGCLLELLEHFEENQLKDPTTRDAAIDTIIQLLESKKSKPTISPVTQ